MGGVSTKKNDKFVNVGAWPCYQIAAVADGLLCGLVGKIVARLVEICKQLLRDELDRTEVGYAFRNAFECASWLKYGCRQEWLFKPCVDVDRAIVQSVREMLDAARGNAELKVILAWHWHEIELDKESKGLIVAQMSDEEVQKCLTPYLEDCVRERMCKASESVDRQIKLRREELECERKEREAKFEYDPEDGYIEYALGEINDRFPGHPEIEEALQFAHDFFNKELDVDADSCGFTITYRNNGESSNIVFDLSVDRLSISEGGYVRFDCGGDSYGSEVWSIEAYASAEGCCDAVSVACDLLALGGEITRLYD